jgi:N-acetylglucosamine kinase-like BadF-type ATPase
MEFMVTQGARGRREKDRTMFRVGGWRPHFGDEGSGFWIGLEAVRAAFRSIDLQTPTEFTERVAITRGLKSVSEVVGAWAGRQLGRSRNCRSFP